MYVRMLVGGKAGEVLDVEPSAARALIASGQAENPYAFRPPVESAAHEDAKDETKKPRKK